VKKATGTFRAGTLVATLLLAAGLSTGCASHRAASQPRPAGGGAASLAFDSPRLRRLERADPSRLDGLPWYAQRNDARLTVEDGYRGTTVEDSATLTYDHQYQSGRHVRDNYSNTTYRRTYSSSIR
jgi:hypothetical protein